MLSLQIMFCPYCGSSITDDTNFCPTCGANLAAAQQAAPEAPVQQEAPVYQETAQPDYSAAPAAESDIPAADSFSYTSFEEVPVKPKKGFGIGKIIAIVAAVGVVVGLAFSAKWIWRNIQKIVAPDAYTRNVEQDNAKDLASSVSKAYGKALTTYDEQVAAEMKIELNVSDEVLDLLENVIPANVGIDPAIINDIALSYGINPDDELIGIFVNLAYKDSAIVNVDGILDMENMAMYLALSNLSKYYIDITSGMENTVAEYNSAQSYITQIQSMMGDIVGALPSEKVLDELIVRYTEIVFDNIDDVNKSSEKVSIDGVSQSLTALEYEIDTKTVLKIAKAVLKEVKNDKDIKNIIEDMVEVLAEQGVLPISDPDEIYDAFKEGVEYALENLDEIDTDNQDLFTLTSYVDGDHNIVGRKIEIEEAEVEARYVTVTKGKKIAREFVLESPTAEVEISGSGTKKGTIESLEYTVEVNGEELVEIAVTDLETKPLENDNYQGKIVITPSEEVMEMILQNADIPQTVMSALNLAELGVSFEFAGNSKSMKYTFGILGRGKALAEVIMTISTKSAKSISLPDDSKIIAMEDADEYLDTIDTEELLKVLKNLGLPSDVMAELESALENGLSNLLAPSYDYDYDYYYGY